RRYVEGKAPGDPVFEVPACLIKRFDADCKRAGIPKRDAAGFTVDVDSLRHTFGTMLPRAGVPPRVAMELMRHSRIMMRTYTDPRLFDLADAVESLPSVAAPRDLRGHSEAFHGTQADPSDRTQVLSDERKRLVSY